MVEIMVNRWYNYLNQKPFRHRTGGHNVQGNIQAGDVPGFRREQHIE